MMRGPCGMSVVSWRAGLACHFLFSLGLLLWTACSAVRSRDGLDFAHVDVQEPSMRSIRHPGQLSVDVSLLISRLLRSELGLFITLNFCISVYAMAALLTTVLFLDRLSARESARLTERIVKYLVFKLIFVSAVVTPELTEVALWLAWFAVVGFMRMFVGAAKDRLEALMATPTSSHSAHARALALLLSMLGTDAAGSWLLWRQAGSTQQLLLFGFDAAVIACDGLKTLLRYGVYLLDQSLAAAHATPTPTAAATTAHQRLWENWEGKGAFLYSTELLADVAIQLLTLAHYSHILWLHGMSFHLVDTLLFLDMRSVVMQTFRRLRAHVHYCAATHNLNHTFPDAEPEVLEAMDDDCAICRDRMQAAKQLPCGHLFHLGCLRAWLQQSGLEFTCPICRLPLFLTATGKPLLPNAPMAPQQRRQQQQQQHGAAGVASWPLSSVTAAAVLRMFSAIAGPGALPHAGASAVRGQQQQQHQQQQELEQQLQAALVSEGMPATQARDLTSLLAMAAHATSGQAEQLSGPPVSSLHGRSSSRADGSSSSFTSGDPLDSDTFGMTSTSADEDVLASMNAEDTDDEDILQSDTYGRRRRRVTCALTQQQRHMRHQHGMQQHEEEVDSPFAEFAAAGAAPGTPQHRLRTPLPAPSPELQTWSSEQLPRALSTVAQAVSSSLRGTSSDAGGRSRGRRATSRSRQQQEVEEGQEEELEAGQEVDSRPVHDQRCTRSRCPAAGASCRNRPSISTGASAECSADEGGQGPGAKALDRQVQQQARHRYITRGAAKAQGR